MLIFAFHCRNSESDHASDYTSPIARCESQTISVPSLTPFMRSVPPLADASARCGSDHTFRMYERFSVTFEPFAKREPVCWNYSRVTI